MHAQITLKLLKPNHYTTFSCQIEPALHSTHILSHTGSQKYVCAKCQHCLCRFPNGESGADVYDRMTIFEDHLVRDINAGALSSSSLCGF